MITNSMANMDSPIYGKSFNQKLIWTESEISMCVKLNDTYETYLSRNRVGEYAVTPEGTYAQLVTLK